MYNTIKEHKLIASSWMILFILFSFQLLLTEEFKIIPVPEPESVFEIQEYNYMGLLTQILKDKMIISDHEFRFRNQQMGYVKSSNFGTNENKAPAAAVLPPPAKLQGLTIRNENGMEISLEELKETVPAIIKFYSRDYKQGSNRSFNISKILVENVIPRDIPDSLYEYKQGLSPYEKHREAIPK